MLSTLSINAPKINPAMASKDRTCNFRGPARWFEVGLQILRATNWIPGSSVTHSLNRGRSLPPVCLEGAQIVVGTFHAMEWASAPDAGVTNDIPLPTRWRHFLRRKQCFFLFIPMHTPRADPLQGLGLWIGFGAGASDICIGFCFITRTYSHL